MVSVQIVKMYKRRGCLLLQNNQQLISNRLLAVLLVAGLFLFAQTETLLHAGEHHFHEHSAACDIYLGVENQSLDLAYFKAPSLEKFSNCCQTKTALACPLLKSLSSYYSRAPPSFS